MAKTAKKRYEITNWAQYNRELQQRGSITFWFRDDVLANWRASNDEVRRGRPAIFSDLAIETTLVLREMFRLPYRQTVGFARSLAQLMQADIPIPDYTLLCKRGKTLQIDLSVQPRRGPIDVVIDSTGLKVFGEGEWKVRAHGADKRRTWRKLHLAIDADTQEILATTVTENSVHDADQAAPLLDAVKQPIHDCCADGAYDCWKVYDRLAARGANPVIPPRRRAKIKRPETSGEPPLPRDEAIRDIRRLGRRAWKEQVGYHRRSLAETAMFRIKTIFGPSLKNRKLPNQIIEATLRCKILNIFAAGLPLSLWI